MAGSRAQLPSEKILPTLEAGKNVIADRFSDSTLPIKVEAGGGYQMAHKP
ncbi:MAG: hypothetical protein Ct9H90mP20_7390 [Candidatus Neomarinimicrobiota bacterium]|nr:MAG: hypothetical protein Ct9H90mP20_7390 [Candidatus Neomarinimicrobiota bacterium]